MLALLAVEGYVYTAAQLGQRMVDTLWLVVAIILIHQLVVRWLLLTQRSLAFHDALERRRLQRAAREATEDEGSAEEMEALQLEEPEIDFEALSDDTTKLINAVLMLVAAFGLWLIWSEVFPAFHFLEELSLWSRTVVVDGQDATGAGYAQRFDSGLAGRPDDCQSRRGACRHCSKLCCWRD